MTHTLLPIAVMISLLFPPDGPAAWAVAGKEVLRLHGAGAKDRVSALDERLGNILSKGDGTLRGGDIVVDTAKNTVTIRVKGDLLVTITSADADANKMSKAALAGRWLTNLRNTLPAVAPKVNRRGA